jgi:hypothetical protein
MMHGMNLTKNDVQESCATFQIHTACGLSLEENL